MTGQVSLLACQETVARVATTDRRATADAVLDVAVKDAMRLVRQGQPGLAEFRLARAARAAARILGAGERGGAR
ncbi:hypothetical protein GON03_19215 [Nocardioides sp. MAH-18]|uniref:Uncharacterized protein n=1 Tax=Nocardioides agri TaxID=2682843 RepID=A0A6L6Y174_9ACTN|nr:MULTISPECIES: hypothetical protein [unclassified Nocardioides]MBA2952149.1 hypothetical protein [Nocardioides sp. CGMCC 1.13656]MVQ51315.1 hypothetical protein [Nocardioides sp. MAH-18]